MTETRFQVLDYAVPAAPPVLASMREVGIDGVVRYLAGPEPAYNWKRLTAPEVADIHAATLDLYVVFQNDNNVLGYFSAEQGRKDGQDCAALAATLGIPERLPVFVAVDFGASEADMRDSIVHYFNEFHAQTRPRPIGIYGGYNVCRWAQRHWRGVNHYWQTAAWSPRVPWDPNGAPVELPGIHLFQHDTGSFANPDVIDKYGHEIDLNVAYIRGWSLASDGGDTNDGIRAAIERLELRYGTHGHTTSGPTGEDGR